MAKSITASTIESFAASWTPTMFSVDEDDDHDAPPTMSQGFVFSGSQKTER